MRIDRRVVLGLTAITMALSAGEIKASGPNPLVDTQRCLQEDPNFLNVKTITMYSYTGGRGGQTSNPKIIDSILHASGRDFWLGYNSQYGGFDLPIKSITDHLQSAFTLPNEGGKRNYIFFYAPPEKPDEIYGMTFSQAQVEHTSTDANGQHDGNHPCAIAAISKAEYNDWLTKMGAVARPKAQPTKRPRK